METLYEAMILAAKENWPPSSETITRLREKEFLIDSERSQQGLPLRFHTAEQLAILLEPDMENQTDEGAYYAHCSRLERHYLPSSAADYLNNPVASHLEEFADEYEKQLSARKSSALKTTEEEEVTETVTVEGRTTITLGALIKQLQELQETLGKNAPVWHVEFGGITGTGGAEEWEGGVVIE